MNEEQLLELYNNLSGLGVLEGTPYEVFKESVGNRGDFITFTESLDKDLKMFAKSSDKQTFIDQYYPIRPKNVVVSDPYNLIPTVEDTVDDSLFGQLDREAKVKAKTAEDLVREEREAQQQKAFAMTPVKFRNLAPQPYSLPEKEKQELESEVRLQTATESGLLPNQVTPKELYQFVYPDESRDAYENVNTVERTFQKGLDEEGKINPYALVRKYGVSKADVKYTPEELMAMPEGSLFGLTTKDWAYIKDYISEHKTLEASQKKKELNLYSQFISKSQQQNIPKEAIQAYETVSSLAPKYESGEITEEEAGALQQSVQLLENLPVEVKAHIPATIEGIERLNSQIEEIHTQYPEIKIVEQLNQKLQDSYDAFYNSLGTASRATRTHPAAFKSLLNVAKSGVEILPTLGNSLASSYDAVAGGFFGDEDSKANSIRRSNAFVQPGTIIDASQQQRSILEKTAKANFEGKTYELGFNERGEVTNVYDNYGSIVYLPEEKMEQIREQADDLGLHGEATKKLNWDSGFNAVTDGIRDLAVTMILSKGLGTAIGGAGGLATRVREGIPLMFQYTGRMAEEAIAQGLTPDEALVYSGLQVGMETGTEMMFPFVGKLTGTAFNTKRALRTLLADPKQLKSIGRREFFDLAIKGPLGEGVEEGTATILGPVVTQASNALTQENLDTDPATWEDIAISASLGLAIGALPGLVGGITKSNQVGSDTYLGQTIFSAVSDENIQKTIAIARSFKKPEYDRIPDILQTTHDETRLDREAEGSEADKIKQVVAKFNAVKRRQDALAASNSPLAETIQKEADALEQDYQKGFAKKPEGTDETSTEGVQAENLEELLPDAETEAEGVKSDAVNDIVNDAVNTTVQDSSASEDTTSDEILPSDSGVSNQQVEADNTAINRQQTEESANNEGVGEGVNEGVNISPSVNSETEIPVNTETLPIRKVEPVKKGELAKGDVVEYEGVDWFVDRLDKDGLRLRRETGVGKSVAYAEKVPVSDITGKVTNQVTNQDTNQVPNTVDKVVENYPAAKAKQTLQNLTKTLQDVFKLPKEKADAAARVTDRLVTTMAERSGKSKQEIYDSISFEIPSEEVYDALIKQGRGKNNDPQEVDGEVRGVLITQDAQYIIYALTNPNVSTPLHELAHVFERYLTPAEIDTIVSAAKTTALVNGKIVPAWTQETSEYFAKGFEQYLRSGIAPVPELKPLFEKFKTWLTEIYKSVRDLNGLNLSPKVVDIYKSMLGINDPNLLTKEEKVERNEVRDRLDFLPQFQIEERPLAPNGKPSNLSIGQWRQVRTPEFKNWFGDWENDPESASKVVDENGEPLVVYHGSDVLNTFSEFEKGDIGFHFGQMREQAEDRLSKGNNLKANEQGLFEDERPDGVGSYFLNIRNPVVLPDAEFWTPANILRMFKEAEPSATWNYDQTVPENIQRILAEIGDNVPLPDGVKYHNRYEGKTSDKDNKAFIAFESNQIKSATDNSGAFNPNDNRIQFQIVGERGAARLDQAEQATTRLDNLAIARQMESEGQGIIPIRLATGWERGADGLWRYEVPDVLSTDKSKLTYSNSKTTVHQRLGDVIDAPILYNAYPELKELSLIIFPDSENIENLEGQFDPENDSISILASIVDTPKGYITLLHELQHAIQRIEGFDSGSNINKGAVMAIAAQRGITVPEYLAKVTELRKAIEDAKTDKLPKEYTFEKSPYLDDKQLPWKAKHPNFVGVVAWGRTKKDAYERALQIENNKRTRAQYQELVDFTTTNVLEARKYYRNKGGEVEARNVETRVGFTEEQRRLMPLLNTEDVSREDQVFLERNLGDNEVQLGEQVGETGGRTLFGTDASIRDSESTDGGVSEVQAMSETETIRGITVKPLPEGLQVVNGFYSPIERNLIETKQQVRTAKQWLEIFGKSDEVVFTGLRDYLESKSPQEKVNKNDIIDYIRKNRIQIVEVVKGENTGKKSVAEQMEDIRNKLRQYGYSLDRDIDFNWNLNRDSNSEDFERAGMEQVPFTFPIEVGSEEWYNAPNEVRDLVAEHERLETTNDSNNEYGTTKYQGYTLPGEKTGYREVLITLPWNPADRLPDDYDVEKGEDGTWRAYDSQHNLVSRGMSAMEAYNNALQQPKTSKDFKFQSQHWDEPNILAHLRMDIRTDSSGDKVLFLEEIQSDWGEKGRDQGFDLDDKGRIIYNLAKDIYNARKRYGRGEIDKSTADSILKGANDVAERNGIKGSEIINALDTYGDFTRDYQKPGIAPAPFVMDTNKWTKLALKYAMQHAVKDGADKIAWTTGEQQNERYSLAKTVDTLYTVKHDDGTYSISGRDKSSDNTFTYEVTAEELPQYVGKDVADEIIKRHTEPIPYKKGSIAAFQKYKEELQESYGKAETRVLERYLQSQDSAESTKYFELKEQAAQEEKSKNQHRQTIDMSNLEVGGAGMKGFYGSPKEDKLGIVGSVAKSLFGEVKTTDILTIESDTEYTWEEDVDGVNYVTHKGEQLTFMSSEAAQKFVNDLKSRRESQHSVEITPKIAAEVKQGLPQFQSVRKTNGPTRKEVLQLITEKRDTLKDLDGQKIFDSNPEYFRDLGITPKNIQRALEGNLGKDPKRWANVPAEVIKAIKDSGVKLSRVSEGWIKVFEDPNLSTSIKIMLFSGADIKKKGLTKDSIAKLARSYVPILTGSNQAKIEGYRKIADSFLSDDSLQKTQEYYAWQNQAALYLKIAFDRLGDVEYLSKIYAKQNERNSIAATQLGSAAEHMLTGKDLLDHRLLELRYEAFGKLYIPNKEGVTPAEVLEEALAEAETTESELLAMWNKLKNSDLGKKLLGELSTAPIKITKANKPKQQKGIDSLNLANQYLAQADLKNVQFQGGIDFAREGLKQLAKAALYFANGDARVARDYFTVQLSGHPDFGDQAYSDQLFDTIYRSPRFAETLAEVRKDLALEKAQKKQESLLTKSRLDPVDSFIQELIWTGNRYENVRIGLHAPQNLTQYTPEAVIIYNGYLGLAEQVAERLAAGEVTVVQANQRLHELSEELQGDFDEMKLPVFTPKFELNFNQKAVTGDKVKVGPDVYKFTAAEDPNDPGKWENIKTGRIALGERRNEIENTFRKRSITKSTPVVNLESLTQDQIENAYNNFKQRFSFEGRKLADKLNPVEEFVYNLYGIDLTGKVQDRVFNKEVGNLFSEEQGRQLHQAIEDPSDSRPLEEKVATITGLPMEDAIKVANSLQDSFDTDLADSKRKILQKYAKSNKSLDKALDVLRSSTGDSTDFMMAFGSDYGFDDMTARDSQKFRDLVDKYKNAQLDIDKKKALDDIGTFLIQNKKESWATKLFNFIVELFYGSMLNGITTLFAPLIGSSFVFIDGMADTMKTLYNSILSGKPTKGAEALWNAYLRGFEGLVKVGAPEMFRILLTGESSVTPFDQDVRLGHAGWWYKLAVQNYKDAITKTGAFRDSGLPARVGAMVASLPFAVAYRTFKAPIYFDALVRGFATPYNQVLKFYYDAIGNGDDFSNFGARVSEALGRTSDIQEILDKEIQDRGLTGTKAATYKLYRQRELWNEFADQDLLKRSDKLARRYAFMQEHVEGKLGYAINTINYMTTPSNFSGWQAQLGSMAGTVLKAIFFPFLKMQGNFANAAMSFTPLNLVKYPLYGAAKGLSKIKLLKRYEAKLTDAADWADPNTFSVGKLQGFVPQAYDGLDKNEFDAQERWHSLFRGVTGTLGLMALIYKLFDFEDEKDEKGDDIKVVKLKNWKQDGSIIVTGSGLSSYAETTSALDGWEPNSVLVKRDGKYRKIAAYDKHVFGVTLAPIGWLTDAALLGHQNNNRYPEQTAYLSVMGEIGKSQGLMLANSLVESVYQLNNDMSTLLEIATAKQSSSRKNEELNKTIKFMNDDWARKAGVAITGGNLVQQITTIQRAMDNKPQLRSESAFKDALVNTFWFDETFDTVTKINQFGSEVHKKPRIFADLDGLSAMVVKPNDPTKSELERAVLENPRLHFPGISMASSDTKLTYIE